MSDVAVGTPATICYYTDTRAAVVTKVTDKSVWVARVEVLPESKRVENEAEVAAGGLPVVLQDGDLTRPIGEPERFPLYSDREGTPYATKGDKTIQVRFGHSVTRIDYRY